MRSIGFRSNILFAIAAAVGIIAALGRPWYGVAPGALRAPAPSETPAQMEELFNGIARGFTAPTGTTGWDALETADVLLAGLATATALLALLALVPVLQVHVRALARWTAVAALGVCALKVFDQPGPNELLEPRYGALVALGACAVLVASTLTVAGAPRQRPPAPVKRYAPIPPPVREPDTTWGPPQY